MSDEKLDQQLFWYAIHTKPRQEDIAEYHLQTLELHTFNPKLKEKKIVRGVRQEVIKPLFPNYIFCKFRCAEFLRLVRYTRGVRKIVGAGDSPTPVDDEIIRIVHERMKDGYVMIEPPELRPGDQVVVEEGPLKGFIGIFERETKDTERVIVLLNTIKYQARLIMERSSLRKM
jgi:transcriptional antiterminator RfaH